MIHALNCACYRFQWDGLECLTQLLSPPNRSAFSTTELHDCSCHGWPDLQEEPPELYKLGPWDGLHSQSKQRYLRGEHDNCPNKNMDNTICAIVAELDLTCHLLLFPPLRPSSRCRTTKAAWWCATAGCRVCSGTQMAVTNLLILSSTPDCAGTLSGSMI